jgi:hypothetical protein
MERWYRLQGRTDDGWHTLYAYVTKEQAERLRDSFCELNPYYPKPKAYRIRVMRRRA